MVMTKETISFCEKEESGQITYEERTNGKTVCTAILIGRGHLFKIGSNPTGMGYGTKMLVHIEKNALREGLAKIIVSQIKDDERVKRFFEKNGYKLKPDADIPDEFEGEKKILYSESLTS
jgi:RimJ/RimL family protein N-acetyltransferase